jgi:hypothetical protein
MKILYFIVFTWHLHPAGLKSWLIFVRDRELAAVLDKDHFICNSTGYWVFNRRQTNPE